MKVFENPEIMIEKYSVSDVIATSNNTYDDEL